MLQAIGKFLVNRAMAKFQGSDIGKAIGAGQGLLGQMTGDQSVATPPFVQQPGQILDPRDATYQNQAPQARRPATPFTPVTAPELNMAPVQPVMSGGVQYDGGIPTLLRSYGDPSVGLLRYLEG